MKKISILLLMLVMSFTGFSQYFETTYEVKGHEPFTINTSPELRELVQEFLTDAVKAGVDITAIKEMEGIYVTDFSRTRAIYGNEPAGMTSTDRAGRLVSFVNRHLIIKSVMNMVLHHELYHVLTWRLATHCTGDNCPPLTREGSEIPDQEILQKWRKNQRQLFRHIRKLQRKGYVHEHV